MKKQASFKEYTVTITDSGSAEVYKLFKNALKGLRELCEANKIDYPEYMGAQKLGTKLLKEQNGGDATAVSAIVGQYIISREPNNGIKVSKLYSNTLGSLRELSKLVGFEFEEKWNTRTFGNKVIDAIESGAFSKLAKAKKVEETVEIEMDEDTTAEAVAPQAVAQEIPADAVLLKPEYPTEIGCEEFECKKFTCVIVPDGVKIIESLGFYSCKNLQRVILPEGLEMISRNAFNGCSELTEINIPASVTDIDSTAFCNCDKLDLGTIYKFEDGVAYNKDKTKVVKVSDPVNVVLPETITEFGNQFRGCETLESIIIPQGITEIGYEAFRNCSKLTEINIPAGVTKINGNAFIYCENLQRVILPDGLEEIGYNAFDGCSELTEVNIPASVTEIDSSTFEGCDKLDLGAIIKFENGVAYNGDKTKIIMIVDPVNVVLPETITEIGRKFEKCETLESIIIPQGITEIGYDAFSSCYKLTEINIPAGVTKIGCDAFYGCKNLQRVILPEGLEEIESRAFANCSELTEINIPASVIEIKEDAFEGCDKLDLGAIYKLEDGVAYNGDRTKIIKVVNPVNLVLPDTITEIESCQFAGCRTLESIVLPEGLVSIGERAFQASGLKRIVIPNSIKKLEDCLFEQCFSMESITLPEGLTEIGYGVFMGCSVESITIPSTVTKIGEAAFTYSGADCCDSSVAMDCIEINFAGGCEEIDGVIYNNDCTEIFYLTDDAVAVVIPEGITSLGGKFRGANCLRSIDLSESGVTELADYEFEVCERLSEITFPDNFESIGESAFNGTRVSGDSLPEQFQDNLEYYGIEDRDDDDDDDYDDEY